MAQWTFKPVYRTTPDCSPQVWVTLSANSSLPELWWQVVEQLDLSLFITYSGPVRNSDPLAMLSHCFTLCYRRVLEVRKLEKKTHDSIAFR